MKDGLLSEVLDWENFGVFNRLDCKTACIFAYSSMREQSIKRSGTRLKTESETRALHLHKTLMPPFTDFITDFEKKTRLFCSLLIGGHLQEVVANRGLIIL